MATPPGNGTHTRARELTALEALNRNWQGAGPPPPPPMAPMSPILLAGGYVHLIRSHRSAVAAEPGKERAA